MNKKRSTIFLFLFAIALLLSALYFSESKDVEVANVIMNCKTYPCEVDFTLTNNLNYYVLCKVSIRGFRRSPGRHVASTAKTGFSGEKTIDVKLSPKEKRKIKETLKISGATSRVSVHAHSFQTID